MVIAATAEKSTLVVKIRGWLRSIVVLTIAKMVNHVGLVEMEGVILEYVKMIVRQIVPTRCVGLIDAVVLVGLTVRGDIFVMPVVLVKQIHIRVVNKTDAIQDQQDQ